MTHPLITAEQLLERIDDPDLRIADVRWYLLDPGGGSDAFDAGHLPGAVHVDLEAHLTASAGPGRHPLPARDETAKVLGSLGFGDEHFVVAYDDAGGAVAARLWWMLRDLGHERVAVLDGGIQAWHRAGGEIVKDVTPNPPASLTVREPLTRQVDADAVRLRADSVHLVDVRAPERYRGEIEPVDPAAGHIPGAINLHFAELLDDDWTFRDGLEHMVGELSDDVIVYCGSGVNACHGILGIVAAGRPEPALYPGSWSDWSSSGGEVATPS